VLGVLLVAVLVASACTSTPARDAPPPPCGSQSPSPSEGLTLHIDKPPSRGVDGGQEVFPLVEEKACPGDADQAGFSFGFRAEDRTESSWTVVATCDDGSKHTVVVVWDSKNADSN
jgi:hypothetical protein